jgi:hypothetical protein
MINTAPIPAADPGEAREQLADFRFVEIENRATSAWVNCSTTASSRTRRWRGAARSDPAEAAAEVDVLGWRAADVASPRATAWNAEQPDLEIAVGEMVRLAITISAQCDVFVAHLCEPVRSRAAPQVWDVPRSLASDMPLPDHAQAALATHAAFRHRHALREPSRVE